MRRLELGNESARGVEMTTEDLAQLIERVRHGASQQVLLQSPTRLGWEPVRQRLEPAI